MKSDEWRKLIEDSTDPLKSVNQKEYRTENSKINQFHERCQRDAGRFGRN
jgi:hypothetical protein